MFSVVIDICNFNIAVELRRRNRLPLTVVTTRRRLRHWDTSGAVAKGGYGAEKQVSLF